MFGNYFKTVYEDEKLWVDSFATYVYSCRIYPLKYFRVSLGRKTIEMSTRQMQ